MTNETHLISLKQKHKEIEDKIHYLQSQSYIDQDQISELKKKKLALKEEIYQLDLTSKKKGHSLSR